MASSSPAPEAPEVSYDPHTATFAPFGPAGDEDRQVWNPTEESVRPVRGRHRVVKQRNGMARSGAVLGVGMIAAVGAGGIATAKEKAPAPISLPDLGEVAENIPGVGGLITESDKGSGPDAEPGTESDAPFGDFGDTLAQAGPDTGDAGATTTLSSDPGEALRARILQQADRQQSNAAQAAVEAAAEQAAEKAAEEAADKAAKEEAERKRKAAEEAARKAEAERLAKLAAGYTLPLTSYQLTSHFGASGSMWANNHTGLDFAAPTGTPVKAVHSGEIVEAGWAGSYGYRVVLRLDDGTEIWYCHLSSMTVTSGKVTTGDVIGRVGSTGNSTGAHLHLEVRPGGGAPIDPLAWLRDKGQSI
ncbi:peptidoglycan DD-metalloendopeptidase family protein [Streptomyces sp. TRM43335]|uniref:Peptidoglycan DD-metalloendopeptidase family protein n=1 Tax=Streptomyces taklimakanensis TaxID=2569853 RepID=A0A6G2BBY5_9ACTN|nr:peptidoglycan DD-metalloendopeptidase family protein [Streptomyces taklimakanensis]